MARSIPRFEADPRLFSAMPSQRVTSPAGDEPEPTDSGSIRGSGEAKSRTGVRRLRLNRLEGLDGSAVLPEPVLPLPPSQAFDVAPLEPEDEEPAPEEFAAALSEAVEIPPAWVRLTELAGGTPVANCLREMLHALEWTGDPRQVVEILPVDGQPLDQHAVPEIFHELGFSATSQAARLRDLGPDDLPALFVAANGDAFVLSHHRDGAIAGFEGKTNLLRPVLADATAGTLYRFTALETGTAKPNEAFAGMFSSLKVAIGGRQWIGIGAALAQGLMGSLSALLLLFAVDHALPSSSLPIIFFYCGAASLLIVCEFIVRAVRDRLLLTAVLTKTARVFDKGLAETFMMSVAKLRATSIGGRAARFRELEGPSAGDVGQIAMAYADLLVACFYLVVLAGVAGWLVAVPFLMFVLLLMAIGLMRQTLADKVSLVMRAYGRLQARWFDDGAVREGAAASGCRASLVARMDNDIIHASEVARDARQFQTLVNSVGIGFVSVGLVAAGLTGFSLIEAGYLTTGELASGLILVGMALTGCRRMIAVSTLAQQVTIANTQAGKLAELGNDQANDRRSVGPKKLAGYVDLSHLSTNVSNGIESVLDNVSVHAEPGDVVVIAGDYQSGKSGLLQVLAGLTPLSSGQARLDGINLTQFDPVQLRQSIAYVPESPEFLPLTIAENLRLMNPLANEAELQSACARAGIMEDIRGLEAGIGANRTVGLNARMDLLSDEPTPGFFKKLALARGYVRGSSVLLLDGPERHLDPEGEQDLMAAIEELRDEVTLIIATDRPAIIRLADRVVWLDGGQVRASGPSTDVLEQLYAEHQIGQTLAAS